jgi:hypothetical protein
VVEGQLKYGPTNANCLKHLTERQEKQIKDYWVIRGYKSGPTNPILSQSAMQNIKVNTSVQEHTEIDEADHDDLLRIVSDHLVFSHQ